MSWEPIPTTVAKRIQQMILDGTLKPGQALPSQRELAETMGASRATIREAISILSTLSMVEVRPGKPTVVLEPGSSSPLGRWRFAARTSEMDLFEVRRLIESYGAFAAALHIDEKLLQNLRGLIQNLRHAAERLDLVEFARHDFEFHRVIVESVGNPVLSRMYADMREYTMESQRIPLFQHRQIGAPIAEHERLLAALEDRDAPGAFRAMRQHVEEAAARIGLTLTPWDL